MGNTKAVMTYSQDHLSEGFMHKFNTNYNRTVLNKGLEKVKNRIGEQRQMSKFLTRKSIHNLQYQILLRGKVVCGYKARQLWKTTMGILEVIALRWDKLEGGNQGWGNLIFWN